MDSSLACVSNADRPRSVTTPRKARSSGAYGYPAGTKKSTGEFDHWLPPWMGGSDTAKKIWFEPHSGKWRPRLCKPIAIAFTRSASPRSFVGLAVRDLVRKVHIT
jgi:hypothetical protein